MWDAGWDVGWDGILFFCDWFCFGAILESADGLFEFGLCEDGFAGLVFL